MFNSYLLFCKTDKLGNLYLKNSRSCSLSSSNKKIAYEKQLGVISFLVLFLLGKNLPRNVSVKKNTSFFRNRSKIFWGYNCNMGHLKFYDFCYDFNLNIFMRSLNLGLIKNIFMFNKKNSKGISDISFIDELSEINFFELRQKFGINLVFTSFGKNYINLYG